MTFQQSSGFNCAQTPSVETNSLTEGLIVSVLAQSETPKTAWTVENFTACFITQNNGVVDYIYITIRCFEIIFWFKHLLPIAKEIKSMEHMEGNKSSNR